MTLAKKAQEALIANVTKVLVTGIGIGIISVIGFYVDFQGLKFRVFALEAKADKIETIDSKVGQIRELICDMAIEKRGPKDKPQSVQKYCTGND